MGERGRDDLEELVLERVAVVHHGKNVVVAQLDEDEDSSDDGLIMDPSYQDPAVDDITDGETPDLNAGDDSTSSVSPTPTPTQIGRAHV